MLQQIYGNFKLLIIHLKVILSVAMYPSSYIRLASWYSSLIQTIELHMITVGRFCLRCPLPSRHYSWKWWWTSGAGTALESLLHALAHGVLYCEKMAPFANLSSYQVLWVIMKRKITSAFFFWKITVRSVNLS